MAIQVQRKLKQEDVEFVANLSIVRQCFRKKEKKRKKKREVMGEKRGKERGREDRQCLDGDESQQNLFFFCSSLLCGLSYIFFPKESINLKVSCTLF